ncbi:hypothetical protein [Succinimonas sp.]|uniref:hypothetical protein n=1 Tax=Succinimonas sp. TaxID=1936151 RepID=UPI003863AF1B
MATTEPQKWSATLGASADVNALPATTPSGSGRASFSGLFPPVTQLPLDQGGIAPERGDFNALFKYLGEYLFYLMQGGMFSYSTDYDYTAGNLVVHGGSLYLCIASNGPGSVIKYPTDTAYWRRLALMSDMPAVGNGTITVQASGTPVGSFTVNQGGNSTINIPEATVSAFGVVKTDERGVYGVQGWVRFRSGIQIVYGAGADNYPITFLRAFNGAPAVSAICPTDGLRAGFVSVFARSATGVTFRVWDPVNNIWSPDGTFTYIAVGTWS